MAKGDPVWLLWIDGDVLYKAAHADAESAAAQAAAEAHSYLGVYDGPSIDAKKLADVKGSHELEGEE
jgi:hypothetical protein